MSGTKIDDELRQCDNARNSVQPLRFVSTAPFISVEAQASLDSLWNCFWTARRYPGVIDDGSLLLVRQGDLVHGVRGVHDISTLASIFENGVLSGEIELLGKQAASEDCETHYCADFWMVEKNLFEGSSVGDYFHWCQTAKQADSILRVPEKNWVPGEMNHTVALIFDPTLPSLEPLLFHSGTARSATSLLGQLIRQFPSSSDRHLAVPIGLPSTGIRTIALGGRISELLKSEIKELVRIQEFKCSVVDYQGNPI